MRIYDLWFSSSFWQRLRQWLITNNGDYDVDDDDDSLFIKSVCDQSATLFIWVGPGSSISYKTTDKHWRKVIKQQTNHQRKSHFKGRFEFKTHCRDWVQNMNPQFLFEALELFLSFICNLQNVNWHKSHLLKVKHSSVFSKPS